MRRSELDDQAAITALIGKRASQHRHRYGRYNVVSLIENSYLSITALAEDGSIVGFGCFEAAPNLEESCEDFFKFFQDTYGKPQWTNTNSIFLVFFCAHEKMTDEVTEFVMRTAFTTLPHVDAALFLKPAAVEPFDIIKNSFPTLPLHPDADTAGTIFKEMEVAVCDRGSYIENLRVRTARVEDHDDLVPIFDSQSEVLTELFGEFFLAEMIQAQDEENRAIVSVVNNHAVGLVALSSEMDTAVLQQCFELEAYDNLVCEAEVVVPDPADIAAKEAARVEALTRSLHALQPKVVLLGPPCAGKTSQAARIAERYGIRQLSAATLVEEAARDESDGGVQASGFLAKQQQVPDHVVALCAAERLAADEVRGKGWVLHDFPANQAQADALKEAAGAEGLGADLVLLLEGDDDALIARAAARQWDAETATLYDTPEALAAVAGDEDVMGRLGSRPQDSEEAVAAAIGAFNAVLPSLLASVEGGAEGGGEGGGDDDDEEGAAKGTLVERVGAVGEVASIFGQLCEAVEAQQEFIAPATAEADEEEGESLLCNAFAVTLFCLDELYDSRARDFLAPCFAQFPDREYCVLTLPPTSPESSLLAAFTLVPPKPDSAFSHCLYLCHRSILLGMAPGGLSVRRAQAADTGKISALLGDGQVHLAATSPRPLPL